MPVAHREAGLRTFNIRAPFPEELNRVLVSTIAAVHFAPTNWAASNLDISTRLEAASLPGFEIPLDPARKVILVTAHRRESSGEPLKQICSVIEQLARRDDVQVVWAVHPSPNIGPLV